MAMSRKYIYFLSAVVFVTLGFIYFGTHSNPSPSNKPPAKKEIVVNEVPILTYHKVSPDPRSGGLGLRVKPYDLDWQMRYLKENGYHSVDLGAVVDHFKNGTKLPEKPVVITFDDGYENNYLYAYPILKKYGFTATIFVATKTVGGINDFDYRKNIQPKNEMLTWRQIKEMRDNGITIGAHTVDHVHLTEVSLPEARNQIMESKNVLEKELKQEIKYFCYPYGEYDQAVADIVKESGFLAATTTDQGLVRSDMNQFLLKRICITGNLDHKKFVEKLHGY
ncbi:MAG: polysaccharide deacetylase family protein [Deltaproteobacteria bacterium]